MALKFKLTEEESGFSYHRHGRFPDRATSNNWFWAEWFDTCSATLFACGKSATTTELWSQDPELASCVWHQVLFFLYIQPPFCLTPVFPRTSARLPLFFYEQEMYTFNIPKCTEVNWTRDKKTYREWSSAAFSWKIVLDTQEVQKRNN